MKKQILGYAIASLIAIALIVGCSNPVGSINSELESSGSRTVYTDNVPPSKNPPGGLQPNQVPMLVSIGFDDNMYSGLEGSAGTGGMKWVLDLFQNKVNNGVGNPGTYDGTPVRASFYNSTVYISTWGSDSPVLVKRAWRRAYEEGHEVGNHTQTHGEGGPSWSLDRWMNELQTCEDWLTKQYTYNPVTYSPDSTIGIGVPKSELTGFRTPFLAYNENTFKAVKNLGYTYDCSVNEGFQSDQDGTNNFYPYTLDNGAPGNDWAIATNPPGQIKDIGHHPGLWEMPLYGVIVPPDEKCVEYGIPVGLRDRLNSRVSWDWDTTAGKITGLDYNMFWLFKMTKDEFVATMKYTLDLRLQGNRAPFMFGAHSDYYASKKGDSPNATYLERQQALQEFVEYALSKQEVRMVPVQKVVDWMKNPVPLNTDPLLEFDITASATVGEGTITPNGTFKTKQYSDQEFIIEPEPGYVIDKVTVDGVEIVVTGNRIVIPNINSNHVIHVTFKKVPTFTVTASATGNGTISPTSKVVNQGDDLTLNLTYGADTQVGQLLVNGIDQNIDKKATTYNLTDVVVNTTVEVVYEPYVSQVEAVYSISSDWGTGFQAKIIITNKTDTAINDWTLNLEFQGNQQIQVYSAIYNQVGKSVTVSNQTWNGTIQPGASLTLGLGGTYSGTNDVPTVTVQ